MKSQAAFFVATNKSAVIFRFENVVTQSVLELHLHQISQ